MTVKTNVKAGGFRWNHNETQATERARSLTAKTGVKAGGFGFSRSGTWHNHNQTQVRDHTHRLTFVAR